MLEKVIKNRIKFTSSRNFKRFYRSLPPTIPEAAMPDVNKYLAEAKIFAYKAEIYEHELLSGKYDTHEERIKLCNLVDKSEYLAEYYLKKALNRRNLAMEEARNNTKK